MCKSCYYRSGDDLPLSVTCLRGGTSCSAPTDTAAGAAPVWTSVLPGEGGRLGGDTSSGRKAPTRGHNTPAPSRDLAGSAPLPRRKGRAQGSPTQTVACRWPDTCTWDRQLCPGHTATLGCWVGLSCPFLNHTAVQKPDNAGQAPLETLKCNKTF